MRKSFRTPITNNRPTFNRNNTSFKDTVLKNTIGVKYPWMFGNTNRITVPEIPLYTVTPATTRATTRLYTPTDIKAFLDLKAFIELLDLVNGYLYTELRNDFDFELDGVPVQVNGNYMRIGNTLLPTYGNTVAKATGYFDTMSKDELELTVKALLKICDENDIKVGIRRA